ncbi:sugar transporter ERD6-like 7 isoform X2 [Camellia sinensis]|uniref:sugar transporter ERD6-like 7 isoform X2 n=1 Tax=Camellia sinensis TaxID=4442 RepID=UPI0010358AA6|nr:sugar transporter ERD6-like 7 isoform X2 [Camellia sinensis]
MDNRHEVEQGENSLQEEIREPLIPEDKTRADEEDGYGAKDQSHKSSTMEHEWMVYLSTFVAVCGSYAFGTCAGYSSPTESAIMDDLDLSLAEYSLFGSVSTLGAMIGAITSGPIADFIGRKGAMRVSSGFCVAGWLAIYFAEGALVLDIGRLATGYAMGVFSYVVPVFIAEIAPTSLRGALTTLNQVMIVAGVSVSYIIGTVLTWRVLALIGLIPCAILLLGLFLIPESPRWLAKIGRQKDFEAALQRLRGKDADISEEAAEIQDYIKTLQLLPKAKLLDLFQRRYLRSVFIGVGLMVCQQLGGLSGISFYVASIFDTAGFPSSTGTIIYACIQVPIAALGATLIDKAGRKPLLLVSGSGMVIGCALTAISFYLEDHEIAVNASPILAVTGILVYIGAFSVGMGAVPWVIMSEVPSSFMVQSTYWLSCSLLWWFLKRKGELWNSYRPPSIFKKKDKKEEPLFPNNF